MKKLISILSVMMVLSVVMALFPTGSAFAAKDPGTVVLIIHNITGANVNFDLVDPGGVHHQTVLPKGITEMSVAQGWHGFFAGLPCGNRSGEFNMNVGKELYFSCGKGDETAGDHINLYNLARRTSPWTCYDVFARLYNSTAPDAADTSSKSWQSIGEICQNYAPNAGDTVLFPKPWDNDDYWVVVFAQTGTDIPCCDAPDWGAAYYHCRRHHGSGA